MAATAPGERNGALDGLRAVAALAVVAVHSGGHLFPGGSLGPDVFFVLSGWLITRLLVAEVEARGRLALRAFYLRRAVRLMPALIASVAFGIAVAAVLWPVSLGDTVRSGVAAVFDLGDVLVPLGVVHSGLLMPTWTLSVEEQFYLLWPVLLLLLLRSGATRAAAPAVLVTALLGVWIVVTGTSVAGFRGAGLFFGCALALLPEQMVSRLWNARATTLAAAVLLLCLVRAPVSIWPVVDIVAGLVVVGAGTGCGGPAGRILAWAPLRWLGRRSYAIYLYNFPVTALLWPILGTHELAMVIANALATTAMAALSWRYVEVPVTRRARRGMLRPRPAIAAVAAAG